MASASAHSEDTDVAADALIPEPISNSLRLPEAPPLGQQHTTQRLRPPVLPAKPSSLSWLRSSHFPDSEQIHLLLGHYFANIHTLRCFAFIPKPSFLRRLDEELVAKHDRNALLQIMCTLGAQFYALDYSDTIRTLSPRFILSAGSEWAISAQRLIFAELGNISVENLMATILLHDYELRMGHFANAFMLTGTTARMAQALRINLEYSTDILCQDAGSVPSASAKESRRRLMWSCYITDALVGSGVDQLTLVDEKDIKIQLPCNERCFLLQTSRITEILELGQVLRFLPPELAPANPADNMGMMTYFIRHIEIRKRVLQYIKHLDTAKAPWLASFEFAVPDTDCRHWYEALPDSLHFTPTAIYIRKETSQLGALCLLHYAYHQTMCDLYRVGAPALYKLRAAFHFPPQQHDFQNHLQYTLYEHAKNLATIAAEAARHGSKTLADSWMPTVTYDSCRIMLYYVTQLIDPRAESSQALILDTIPHIQHNIRALKMMRSLFAVADPLCTAAETMLEKFCVGSEIVRRNIMPDDPFMPNPDGVERCDYGLICASLGRFTDYKDSKYRSNISGTPPQSAPDYVLNPLSLYRMARKAIPEKHAPETIASPATSTINTAQQASYSDSPLQLVTYANNDENRDMCTSTNTNLNDSFDPAVAECTNFDELQMVFPSDSGWNWYPAETAVESGTEGAGLPPWMPSAPGRRTLPTGVDPQLNFWWPTS